MFHHTKLPTFGQRPSRSQEDLAWRQRFGEHDPELQALCTFVENRYWTRLWVVQELLLARIILVYYGDVVVPWEHIMESRSCIYQLEELREQAEFLVRLIKPNLRSPCEVIRAFSVHKCQDYHDGVYGLLALFEEGGMRWPYAMDYNVSSKDLFIDMAVVLFSTEQDLPPLALARLSTTLPVKVISDLASERRANQERINGNRRARGEVELVFDSGGYIDGPQDMHQYFASLMGDFYGRHFDQEAERRLRDILERHLTEVDAIDTR